MKHRANPCTGAASVTGTRCRGRQEAAKTSIGPGAVCQSTDISEEGEKKLSSHSSRR